MALVSKMVSDISGVEADEKQFVSLVVKQHPAIDSPKALDVLPDEVKNLKEDDSIVVCEVKANGDSREVVLSHSEFKKLCSDEKVVAARGTRGRRPGWKAANQDGK